MLKKKKEMTCTIEIQKFRRMNSFQNKEINDTVSKTKEANKQTNKQKQTNKAYTFLDCVCQ